jgi:hypothetical protein
LPYLVVLHARRRTPSYCCSIALRRRRCKVGESRRALAWCIRPLSWKTNSRTRHLREALHDN